MCGKSENHLAQRSGLDATFVRRQFDLTIIRLTIALVMDPELDLTPPAQVPFLLKALTDAQLRDAIALGAVIIA